MIPESQISQIIDAIIQREGGVSNDPADRGGLTSAGGVTQPFAQQWNIPWPNPTLQQVHDGYRRMLAGTRIDQIPDAATLNLVADCAVNHGSSRAIQWLQQALGMAADGVVGPNTISAMTPARLMSRLISNRIITSRGLYYADIIHNDPSQAKFARGWYSRLFSFLT